MPTIHNLNVNKLYLFAAVHDCSPLFAMYIAIISLVFIVISLDSSFAVCVLTLVLFYCIHIPKLDDNMVRLWYNIRVPIIYIMNYEYQQSTVPKRL